MRLQNFKYLLIVIIYIISGYFATEYYYYQNDSKAGMVLWNSLTRPQKIRQANFLYPLLIWQKPLMRKGITDPIHMTTEGNRLKARL
jgi:hypothetical protein